MANRIVDVAARYSADAKRPPIPCRLVVDPEQGILYCGKPRLFSTEVLVGNRFFEARILDLDKDGDNPGGPTKHGFLDSTH